MDQLKKLWGSMSSFQKASIVVAVLLAVGAYLAVSNWRTDASYKALYKGMSTEDAGQAVQSAE